MIRTLLVLSVLSLTACHASSNDCKKAMNHMMDVTEKEVEKLLAEAPEDQKAEIKGQMDQLKTMREQAVKECEGKVMKKETFDCIMKTTKVEEFEKCPMFNE